MKRVLDTNFRQEVLHADRPTVVMFGRPGCSPCQDVRAEMALLERMYADTVFVCFAEQDEAPTSCRRYAPSGVPLVIVFHDGLEVWRRRGGSVTASMVSTWIDDLLETK